MGGDTKKPKRTRGWRIVIWIKVRVAKSCYRQNGKSPLKKEKRKGPASAV